MTPATSMTKEAKRLEYRWDPESVPPFPSVAVKALKLIAGTDTSLLELCNLIRCDPIFSSAVLRIANSPLVAFPKAVTNVLQASMLLGFVRLRRLVITLGLKAYFNNSFTPLLQLCWRHSVACALIAERAANWSHLDTEFAYTSGILHDIGRVALARMMPESYARVAEHGADNSLNLLEREREFCGIDHCDAGSALVEAWSLPQAFQNVVGCHHASDAAFTGTDSLLPPSCATADSLGFEVIHCRSSRSYVEILGDFPERTRARFPVEAKEFASDIANEIQLIESV